MAARDKGTLILQCRNCKAEGALEYSENDEPFMRTLDFTVDEIVGPFYVLGKQENLRTTEVHCKACGSKVPKIAAQQR